MKKNAGRLRQAMIESHNLANRLDKAGFPLAELEHLQDWQRQRLAACYQDLIGQQRYRAAGDFFLAEIYGGLNFRERDQEMARVFPVMVRMLRDDMILAVAEAFELQTLSLDLDIGMTMAFREHGWSELNTARYVETYQSCGRPAERSQQLELIRRLGLQLNKLVHHRLVLLLIRTVRRPARAAGFGLLQTFLEQGLYAFRTMGDGSEFIDTIWRREREVMSRLQAGDENPFAQAASRR